MLETQKLEVRLHSAWMTDTRLLLLETAIKANNKTCLFNPLIAVCTFRRIKKLSLLIYSFKINHSVKKTLKVYISEHAQSFALSFTGVYGM